MRIEGAGSRVIITPSDGPASPQTEGPPLLEAMVGLGSLVERTHTALYAEDLTATTRWQWQQSSYPRGVIIDIGLQRP